MTSTGQHQSTPLGSESLWKIVAAVCAGAAFMTALLSPTTYYAWLDSAAAAKHSTGTSLTAEDVAVMLLLSALPGTLFAVLSLYAVKGYRIAGLGVWMLMFFGGLGTAMATHMFVTANPDLFTEPGFILTGALWDAYGWSSLVIFPVLFITIFVDLILNMVWVVVAGMLEIVIVPLSGYVGMMVGFLCGAPLLMYTAWSRRRKQRAALVG